MIKKKKKKIRISIHPKMLDPDPYQMYTDPKPCYQYRQIFVILINIKYLRYSLDT
jgi:hypothetical protein